MQALPRPRKSKKFPFRFPKWQQPVNLDLAESQLKFHFHHFHRKSTAKVTKVHLIPYFISLILSNSFGGLFIFIYILPKTC